MELCTEQLYSLLIFPCTVKYKSDSSSSLFFILFYIYVAHGAFDIYYFLLFVPIVLIPFSPTSVLSLQPFLVCFMEQNRLLDTVIFACCFWGWLSFYLFISLECQTIVLHFWCPQCRCLYLVNGKSKASHNFLFEPLTSGLYRQHGKEEKGFASLHYSHCPTLCSVLMQISATCTGQA